MMLNSSPEEQIEYLKGVIDKIKPFYSITGKVKDEDFAVVRRSILHTIELANDWIEKYNCQEEPKIMDWHHGSKFFAFNVQKMYDELKDSRQMRQVIKDRITWIDLELAGGQYNANTYEYLYTIKTELERLLNPITEVSSK